MMGNRRVLIVDDDIDFAESLLDILKAENYRIEIANSANGALSAAKVFAPHVALLDIRLGQADGLDLLTILNQQHPKLLCIIMTAYANVETAIKALQRDAYDYLRKPLYPEELSATLHRCFERIDLEQKHQQAIMALRASEERYHSIFENALEGIFRCTPGEGFSDVNPALVQMLGYNSKEDVLALDLAHDLYVHADEFREVLDRLQTDTAVKNAEVSWKKKTGDPIIVSINSRIIQDVQGHIVGYEGMVQDITERRQAELKLQERNRFIDTILENAPIGFALSTIDDRQIIFTNRAFEEIHDIPHGSVKTVDELFDKAFADPVLREETRERFMADIADGDSSHACWENAPLTTMKGEHKFTTGINIPLWDQNLMIATVQDVTERKRAEDEIRHLNAELEIRVKARTAELEFANRELKDFAYVVSHDLKAPLRAISRLASWLRDDYAPAFDDKGHEMVDLLIGRVKRMDNLIDGILEYSRIGRIESARVPVDLNQLVADVLDSLAPPEHVHITVAHELPTLIVGRTRIFQVFQNLIGNAIKFMDKPQGLIGIQCIEDEESWRFSVVDNGPGIDPKYHDRIFQIFQTLRSRDEFESTGIGLAVVKKIVELHGGKIWLQSTVGEGSQFFFTLPRTLTC
jgi:two-component system sensor kinase FixL